MDGAPARRIDVSGAAARIFTPDRNHRGEPATMREYRLRSGRAGEYDTSAVVVFVVAAEPEAFLVAALGGAVEPLVHAPEPVQSAGVGGIGVVDGASSRTSALMPGRSRM